MAFRPFQTIKPFYLLTALVLLGGMPAAAATNDEQIQTSTKLWAAQNACVRGAWKKFPDYTAVAAVKRDQETNACLKSHGLLPLQPQSRSAPNPSQ